MTCNHKPSPKDVLSAAGSFLRLAVLLGSGLFLGASVMAQGPAAPAAANVVNAVSVVLTQSKVVKNAKGVEQLVAAPTVMPGDVIEYKATYKNNSAKPVTGLVANLPIPEGLEYLPKSAKPGATLVTVATKDSVYAVEPLMRKLPDGNVAPVPYVDYRALRWTLGQLPAGGEAAVTARARVEGVAAASTAVSVPVSNAAK